MKTLRVSFDIGHRVGQDVLAYLDESQRDKPLGSRMVVVNALREVQSASGEELSALMPSILDKAFKGEL